METYDLLIIYRDGTNKIVEGVTNYGIQADGNLFYFTKNGRKSWVPIENVQFFGSEYDYNSRVVRR